MSRNVLYVSAIVALTGSIAAFAQQAEPNRQDQSSQTQSSSQNQSQAQGQWKNSDHCFATCIALGNQEEIALSELGKQKAQSEDVKNFAEMLVQDHTEFLKKLQKFAPEACQAGCLRSAANGRSTDSKTSTKSNLENGQNATTTEKSETAKSETANSETAQKQTNGSQNAGSQHAFRQAQIEKELAQQCLMSATEKLNEKSGAEFDKCFIGLQIGKHIGMKDKLIVYQRHATSELAEVLAAGQKKTEEHLAKAEKLMKSLEQDSTGKASKTASTADNDRQTTADRKADKDDDKEDDKKEKNDK